MLGIIGAMDEDMKEMAELVEELRKELYETASSNRSCHVKAEDMMELLEQCRKGKPRL